MNVKVGRTFFKNPIVATAGDPTLNAKLIKKCITAGAGAVIFKTMSLTTNWVFTHGIVDEFVWTRMAPGFLDKYGEPGSYALYAPGCAQKSPDEAVKILKEVKPTAEAEEVVVIASIGAGTSQFETWRELAEIANGAGFDMVEVMIGCPFMEKERTQTRILKTVREAVDIPVIIKTPGENEFFIKQLASDVEAGKADAWHVQGSSPQQTIDIETGRPILPVNMCYGRRGRGIGVASALMAKQFSKIPILSSGGIFTWRDAVERLMAGATLAGIHSAVRYYGFKVFTQVVQGIRDFLQSHDYEKVTDVVGLATPFVGARQWEEWLKAHAVPKEKVLILLDRMKCT